MLCCLLCDEECGGVCLVLVGVTKYVYVEGAHGYFAMLGLFFYVRKE